MMFSLELHLALLPTAHCPLPTAQDAVEDTAGVDHTIVLGGLSIQKGHCMFSRKGRKVTLTPKEDGTAQVLVNGKRSIYLT